MLKIYDPGIRITVEGITLEICIESWNF